MIYFNVYLRDIELINSCKLNLRKIYWLKADASWVGSSNGRTV